MEFPDFVVPICDDFPDFLEILKNQFFGCVDLGTRFFVHEPYGARCGCGGGHGSYVRDRECVQRVDSRSLRRQNISETVALGTADLRAANAPEMCGAAIDVPS